ncbi:MAG: hypothetical protein HY372_01960 [Candidatus Andersenbacteria bacterium]|nr:hypothetical protein [Candidatus Andersenbacteria bacterium]
MKVNHLLNDIGCCLTLLAITISLFIYTVHIRRPWFAAISDSHHEWLTGSTTIFAHNAYRDGPWQLRFANIFNPRSVEFPTLESRKMYPSYPPGTTLTIYALAVLAGSEPSPALIMRYNLINHFLIAFSLALLTYLTVRQFSIGYLSATIFATVPIIIELLMPAPLYWHQNVFFSDQAVTFPYVLIILLEAIRDSTNRKLTRWLVATLHALLMFYGVLTDWLFTLVAPVLFLKRLLVEGVGTKHKLRNLLKTAVLFWAPPALALGLFALQLSYFDNLPLLQERFACRTTGSTICNNFSGRFFAVFWQGYVRNGFGAPAIWLLWGSLAALVGNLWTTGLAKLFGKTPGPEFKHMASLAALLLVPSFLQTYILKAHSGDHDFSALKFTIPLATLPLAIIPAFLVAQLRSKLPTAMFKRTAAVTAATLAIATIFYVAREHPRFSSFFPPPDPHSEHLGRFIQQYTDDNHIVFSPHFSIPELPPSQLAHSLKRVYSAHTWQDIKTFTDNIEDEYTIALVFLKEPDPQWTEPVGGTLYVNKVKQFYYLVVEPTSWQRLARQLSMPPVQ